MNVETNCWLDFLDNETIEKINQLIEKHNMKIVDTDEKCFLKRNIKRLLLYHIMSKRKPKISYLYIIF